VELLDCFRQVKAARPGVKLLVLGELESGDPIPERVREAFRADPDITLVGFVAEPERYYPLFDLLLFPTHREGFGNVATEASAAGVPVVAFSVTGVRDSVADGVSGTLVPYLDVDGLVAAVLAYLDDPELRQRHGQQGRARVERRFPRERVWSLWRDAYRTWMDQRGILPLERE
jgi:glycosyltransferase involved in cell wall biosynthesis